MPFYNFYFDDMKNGRSNNNADAAPFMMLDDKKSSLPLHRQIYEALRTAILKGDFRARAKLPSTRAFAAQLGVSRMTVVVAYDQLYAEGYLEGKSGAGTFVAPELPEELLETSKSRKFLPSEDSDSIQQRKLNLSAHGRWLAETRYPDVLRVERSSKFLPFQHGLPAVDEFPFEIWSRIAQKWHRNPPRELLGYGVPAGYRPLREAIAAHLKSARGVNCDYKQVIITSGAQHALTLAAKVFLDAGDTTLIEDPCYLGAKASLLAAGAKLVPVPVDDNGFDLKAALAKSKNAKLVYVTPSHQYPLGVTMCLPRRLALIEWAKKNDAWILEDDYNSEYRYGGRPLASLQGLDRDGRVLYTGTFSKTIFPSIRIGCLVVPKDLADVFAVARSLGDLHSPLIDQAILTEFITEGHFARHIRRMRKLYEQRQQTLVEEADKHLGGLLELQKSDAGMHLVGWLPKEINAEIVAEKAAAQNLKVSPIAAYSFSPNPPNGLILGYTSFTEKQIKAGVRKLAQILKQMS
jgi:GntR family transcriptional regulator/MocR family aminotransferase